MIFRTPLLVGTPKRFTAGRRFAGSPRRTGRRVVPADKVTHEIKEVDGTLWNRPASRACFAR